MVVVLVAAKIEMAAMVIVVALAAVPLIAVVAMPRAGVSSGMATAVVQVHSQRMSSSKKNLRMSQNQSQQHSSRSVGRPVTYQVPFAREVVAVMVIPVVVHLSAYVRLVVLPLE